MDRELVSSRIVEERLTVSQPLKYSGRLLLLRKCSELGEDQRLWRQSLGHQRRDKVSSAASRTNRSLSIISISCDSQMSLRPSPALFASSSSLLKCLRLLALVQHNCRDMRTLHSSAMCFSGHSKWSKIRHKKGKPLSLAPTNAL